MKTFCATLFSLVTWTLAMPANASDDAAIEWYVNNFPPVIITAGPDVGRGWADKRVQRLTRRLTTFRHEVVNASAIRMFEDMKTKPNICSAFLLKTPEREAFIEFSKPFSWIVPNGVVVTTARYATLKPYMNEQGELHLGNMLADGRRIGISATRSYGEGIDVAIKKYRDKPVVVVVPSSNFPAGRLLKLIDQDEYDVTPGYSEELMYMASENAIDRKDIAFLPVAEQPPLIPTYVGCSKSELGKQFIAAINQLIADPDVQKEDSAAYRMWLDEKTAARYDLLRSRLPLGK